MFGLNSKKTGKVIELLKKSESDFKFDKAGVKNRLMTSIYSKKLGVPTVLPIRHRYIKRTVTFGTSLAIVATLVTSVVVADAAKPGDKLYFLDQLEEELALKFPRSASSRAVYQSEIINERVEELKELDAVTPTPVLNSAKLKIREKTQQEIINAVNEATKAKASAGNDQKKQTQINDVLNKLEKFAGEQEEELEKKRDRYNNNDNQDDDNRWNDDYEKRLEAIKNARQKARAESERSYDDRGNRGWNSGN